MLGLSGDLLPTPGVGVSSNITSPFPAGPLVNLGTPSRGGVGGFEVAGPHPGVCFEFDWTGGGVRGPGDD